MFTSIRSFEKTWTYESESTRKLLRVLTDASLAQAVTPEDRTLGRIAWHLATSISEIAGRTGLELAGPTHGAPMPKTAAEIAAGYEQAARSLLEQVRASWTDDTLQAKDTMYGETWKRGVTLAVVVSHQTHHRGQMTVLMRQAGLSVPGVYGPAREEWAALGAPTPVV